MSMAWIEASAVSGAIFGISDIFAQCGARIAKRMKRERKEPAVTTPAPPPVGAVVAEEEEPMDVVRTARLSTIGVLYGPVLYYYYVVLDSKVKSIWMKMAIDFAIYNPIVNTVFISLNQIGKDSGSVMNVPKALRAQLPQVFLVAGTYWLFLDYVIFAYVPLGHQVLVTRCFGFILDIYLSHATNRKEEGEKTISQEGDGVKIE